MQRALQSSGWICAACQRECRPLCVFARDDRSTENFEPLRELRAQSRRRPRRLSICQAQPVLFRSHSEFGIEGFAQDAKIVLPAIHAGRGLMLDWLRQVAVVFLDGPDQTVFARTCQNAGPRGSCQAIRKGSARKARAPFRPSVSALTCFHVPVREDTKAWLWA